MKYHVFFGILTFVLSVITALLGFSEKNMFASYVFNTQNILKCTNKAVFNFFIGVSYFTVFQRKEYF